MKSNITTAEEACMIPKSHGMQAVSPKDMAAFIEEIRCSQPWFEHYLSHPEITIGLAQGRYGKKGLIRRLTEMHAVDNQDEYANG